MGSAAGGLQGCASPGGRTTQRVARTEGGCLRVIDVIPQHVEGVVHAAPEVEAVEMLGEVLPPAHIQQVAGELVKALQLCSGGDKGKGEVQVSFYQVSAPSSGWQKASAHQSQPIRLSTQHLSLLERQVMGFIPSSFTHVFIDCTKY